MLPEHKYSDEQIVECVRDYYGKSFDIGEGQIPYYRDKLSSLANFMKELKQSFTVYYNRRHGRRGTLWGERFKSVIVEDGDTLINCLAYVELNPVRAGLVQRPEDYRWNSLGYYFQTNNKDNILSMDFGLKEFGVRATQERLRRYRRYVYEAGAVKHPGKPGSRIIEEKNCSTPNWKRNQSRSRGSIEGHLLEPLNQSLLYALLNTLLHALLHAFMINFTKGAFCKFHDSVAFLALFGMGLPGALECVTHYDH